MEKLRLRCPSCQKLYEVSDADIRSHSPQFDCVVCSTRFGVNFNPTAKQELTPTFVVMKSEEGEQARTFQQEMESRSLAALQSEIGTQASEKTPTRACPKCGALNDKKLTECYSCHVLFERLDQLPLDPLLRAQPSLVRKWKNLVLNFDNQELHDDFLKSCHQLEALRFAILKYEDLKKAQGGGDELCKAMIAKAQGLLYVTLSSKSSPLVTPPQKPKNLPKPWEKWVLWVPIFISVSMMVVGFSSLSQRNLVGAGVAVLLLTLGLVLFWKGRISISDFHR
jgi:hypothetical protein